MRPALLLLLSALVACSADPTCQRMDEARDKAAREGAPCGSSVDDFDRDNCEAHIDECDEVDRNAIGKAAECLELLECDPETDNPDNSPLGGKFMSGVIGCGFKLISIGERCKRALKASD